MEKNQKQCHKKLRHSHKKKSKSYTLTSLLERWNGGARVGERLDLDLCVCVLCRCVYVLRPRKWELNVVQLNEQHAPKCVHNAKNFIFTFLVFYTEILYVPFKYIWRVLFYHKLFLWWWFCTMPCLFACLPTWPFNFNQYIYKTIYHMYNTQSTSQPACQPVSVPLYSTVRTHNKYYTVHYSTEYYITIL